MSLLLILNYKHYDAGGVPTTHSGDSHKYLARKKFDDEYSLVIKELREKDKKRKEDAQLEEDLMIALLMLED